MPLQLPTTEEALTCLEDWLDSDQTVFGLGGEAGSGKTTLLGKFLEGRNAPVLALSNKAAAVLRSKGVGQAQTIHSWVYKKGSGENLDSKIELLTNNYFTQEDEEVKACLLREINNLKALRRRLPDMTWEPREFTDTNKPLVVVDEASMVGEGQLWSDLRESTWGKILLVGDPSQLPPVKDKPVFKPDAILTTQFRQDQESELFRIARNVRTGGALPPRPYGNELKVPFPEEGIVWLCYTNRTRSALNHVIRAALDFGGKGFAVGELVAGERKSSEGIMKGVRYTVQAKEAGYLLLKGEGGFPDTMIKETEAENYLTYGYVITVHKAQGSEWETVVVVDDVPRGGGFPLRPWWYTAVTRSKKNLWVMTQNWANRLTKAIPF